MTRVAHLTTFEHRDLAIGVPGAEAVSPAEADALSALTWQYAGWCERGHRSLRIKHYCGLVALDGRMLEILPKLDPEASASQCRGVLLRLLRLSGELPELPEQSASHHLRHATLLEIFIGAFLHEVAALVHGGLLQRYQEYAEDLTCVRGAIQLQRQFTANSNRVDRLACCFDEFTADNVWNGLVKAGLLAVRHWVQGPDISRLWTTLMAHFGDVRAPASPLSRLERLVYDRQGHRYRPVLRWVEVILRLLSPDLRAGRASAPALLFDMNKLFESAVTNTFRRAKSRDGLQVVAQSSGTYLALTESAPCQEEFQLRPDLLVRRGDHVVQVLDCKWKWLERSSAGYLVPAQADVYQMHAYAARFACSDVALIYPWHESYHSARLTSFTLPLSTGRCRLQLRCVDLGSDELRAVHYRSAEVSL